MSATRDAFFRETVSRVIPEGRRLGLVIGIDAYGDDSGIPRLSAAVADARVIHAAMIDPECGRFAQELTTVLTDAQATDSAIRVALEKLRKSATRDDEVWFFYAGHAVLVDGEHRLLPANAQSEFLDATTVHFAELFRKIQCRRKIVFLDCCHAGAADASTRHVHDVEEVFKSYQASGTITYCSSEGDQKSVELEEVGHGAFTYWLERGLRGEADADGSGVVTSDELWRYVCIHVEADAKRLTGHTQTPRLKADTSGAFALSVNAKAVRRRVEDEERKVAEASAIAARLDADRRTLREMLGEDDVENLSTDELKAAIRALEADSPPAKQIRKAVETYRVSADIGDTTARVRGALSTRPVASSPGTAVAPPPIVNPPVDPASEEAKKEAKKEVRAPESDRRPAPKPKPALLEPPAVPQARLRTATYVGIAAALIVAVVIGSVMLDEPAMSPAPPPTVTTSAPIPEPAMSPAPPPTVTTSAPIPAPALAADSLNKPIWIKGGMFQMGRSGGDPDEQPQHQVNVSGFWMQQHEVTNEEYQRFDATRRFPAGQKRFPVSNVTWAEASAYAKSRSGRLPTEAEWEFAARGTSGRTYPWGNAAPTCALAQFGGCEPRMIIAVMSRPLGATAEGVHDLADSVYEWVSDWKNNQYPAGAATDPTGPATGVFRVLRGGWESSGYDLRASNRNSNPPDDALSVIGFRVVWGALGGQE